MSYVSSYLFPSMVSPSSRRAWIEICDCTEHGHNPAAALLAEGVDRNLLLKYDVGTHNKSPSSRRAWIEIAVG